MPGILTNLNSSIDRWNERQVRIEYCTVLDVDYKGNPGIQCHSPDKPEYWNTVTVKVRNIKKQSDPNKAEHHNVLVLQHNVGNCFGDPYTPRVGDLVVVLFVFNNKPLILGPVLTLQMMPFFRAPTSEDAKYDLVSKWCQWQQPNKDARHDFFGHPQGKQPICKKRFHGPVIGVQGRGRDDQMVWDCQMGDADPTCEFCETIDSVPRSGEQWNKVYSSDTESEEAYNSRMEQHARCGSYLRFESDDDNYAGKTSPEYSEGVGHIRLGSAVAENTKRAHLNFHPSGVLDMHSTHEETIIESEVLGSRVTVVPDSTYSYTDSHGSIACEVEYLPKKAFIRIYKDGSILLQSNSNGSTPRAEVLLDIDGTFRLKDLTHNNYVKTFTSGVMEASSDVELDVTAPTVKIIGDTKVEVNAPIVEINAATKVQFNTPKIYMGGTLIHGVE